MNAIEKPPLALNAKVVAIEHGRYEVHTDAALPALQVMYLRAHFEGSACTIGAVGRVEFREGPGYGLWFFVPVEPVAAIVWQVFAHRTGIVHAERGAYLDAETKAKEMAARHNQGFGVRPKPRGGA